MWFSLTAFVKTWEHDDTKQLLQAWKVSYNEGQAVTSFLRSFATLLYLLGAWKATRNRKQLIAAALITAVGDPIAWTYMKVRTKELIAWRAESMSYDSTRSFAESHLAQEAIVRWSILYSLRSLEALLGVVLSLKYTREE